MSIIEKLHLTKYQHMAVLHEPEDYDIFQAFPKSLTKDHDAIFIFVLTIDEMIAQTTYMLENNDVLSERGYLFFAYPKKGNKRYETYIHRDEIFPALHVDEDGYVANSELKFSRMVSMDDIFTVVGLKREKKKSKKSTAASQTVADYDGLEKDVEDILASHPTELAFYQGLTPGYRRDWARYIFSAKQQKTRDKRAEQMVSILSEGYKTIDLYRMKKK
jgi:hypothetical protein